MTFKAIEETHPWGKEFYRLADLGVYDTQVGNGWLEDNSLDEVMETYMDRVVGDFVFSYTGRLFPVMVRALEVEERLPLTVSPDDEVAGQRYDALGKTKLWYIADARPGSKLYIGFKEDVSASRLYEGCMDGSIVSSLRELTPHAGDHFFISPGTVHSAEGGLKIIEVAEASPLDFTLTEWTGAGDAQAQIKGDGMEDMGIVAAMDFMDMKAFDPLKNMKASQSGTPAEGDEGAAEKLCKCNEFSVNRIRLNDAIHVIAGRFDSFICYYSLKGSADVQAVEKDDEGKSSTSLYRLDEGKCILVPAECPDFFVLPRERDTLLLEIMQEPHEEDDEYINKEAEEHIPGEDYDTEETEDDRLDYEIRHNSLHNIKII